LIKVEVEVVEVSEAEEGDEVNDAKEVLKPEKNTTYRGLQSSRFLN
jgi:hypothetical protein